jgi:excisionase family DNA binding protein
MPAAMTKLPNKQWFRPDEVAAMLEEPIKNVYFWLRTGRIKHVHFGRKTKIHRDEISRIMREGIRTVGNSW